MSLSDDFDALQQEVNADPEHVTEARRRRAVILGAFAREPDVLETVPSGSLARGSQIDPIHDVDLIIVFDPDEHPSWGAPGGSAREALELLQARVQELVGVNQGRLASEVRRADVKNHSVKCFLDDPGQEDAFTVDVMPALRHPEGGLSVPEAASKAWIRTDPEHLMAAVAERHGEWGQFVKLVRVLKRWNRDNGKPFKSLTLEVLALERMPVAERPEALARFFEAVHAVVDEPVCDPAGLCGEIQPDLERERARELLETASQKAWDALDAAASGDEAAACALWHEVLGDAFPTPPAGAGGSGAGVGAGAAAAIAAPSVIARPRRPVIDAPQG
jgi:hypothetical protein